jgi:hypothetical protein
MGKIVLEVENSAVEKVMWFLEQLKEVVRVESCESDDHPRADLENDPLAQELKRRVQEIDDGTAVLTPFQEGMDAMMERIRFKHASA